VAWLLRTPPIPCAAKKRHPCRFFALSFCFAKTHEFLVTGIHAGLGRLRDYATSFGVGKEII
jgi:hypothetical protein